MGKFFLLVIVCGCIMYGTYTYVSAIYTKPIGFIALIVVSFFVYQFLSVMYSKER